MTETGFEGVLEFWFGAETEVGNHYLQERNRFWFQGGETVDQQIRERYLSLIEEAALGKLISWEESARSTLALLLLLDQFPRNIFRGTAKAFFFDPIARRICLDALALKRDQELAPVERVFFYLPLEHAEDAYLQQLSVKKFRELASNKPPDQEPVFASFLRYAEAHQDTVRKFNRFPGRNKSLQRENTPEEEEFLASGRLFVGM